MLAALDYGYFGDDIILPAAQGPRWPSWLTEKSLKTARRRAPGRRFLRVGQIGRSDEAHWTHGQSRLYVANGIRPARASGQPGTFKKFLKPKLKLS